MWSIECFSSRILPNHTQEIDISENMQEIDISENKKETDISENNLEIGVSENNEEDIQTSRINIVLNILGIFITLYGFLFSLGLMGDSN